VAAKHFVELKFVGLTLTLEATLNICIVKCSVGTWCLYATSISSDSSNALSAVSYKFMEIFFSINIFAWHYYRGDCHCRLLRKLCRLCAGTRNQSRSDWQAIKFYCNPRLADGVTDRPTSFDNSCVVDSYSTWNLNKFSRKMTNTWSRSCETRKISSRGGTIFLIDSICIDRCKLSWTFINSLWFSQYGDYQHCRS
jgi:hypothetical protein